MDMKFVYWVLQYLFWYLPVIMLGATCIILARRTGNVRRKVRKKQVLEDDFGKYGKHEDNGVED